MQDQPAHGSVRLVIVLQRAADPITGQLLEPSTLAGNFCGWLALATLIESARLDADHPGSAKPRGGLEPDSKDQGHSLM